MRYLIVEDERDTVCMALLPARNSREEAQREVDRMNALVETNNKQYAEFKKRLDSGAKLSHGEVFLYREDKRKFAIKEIE